MTWIAFTFLAAFSQTLRNGLQANLSQHMNVLGVTLARFILAGPLVVIYILCLYSFSDHSLPEFNLSFAFYCLGAAIMQIIATNLMVVLFKRNNFAIGAGLAKSEALVAAILGSMFFGSMITPLGWVGVLVGTIAIFLLSSHKSTGGFKLSTALIGLASGTSFALTSLFVREASLALDLGFPFSAAWVLLTVIGLQTIGLLVYLLIRQPETLRQMAAHPKTVALVSLTSCVGSIGWFTAMSLQYVAYVKTVGQVEVLFTIVLASIMAGSPIKRNEILGLILIGVAAILVMYGNL